MVTRRQYVKTSLNFINLPDLIKVLSVCFHKYINCIHANKKMKTLYVNHMVTDSDCPCYKRIIHLEDSKTKHVINISFAIAHINVRSLAAHFIHFKNHVFSKQYTIILVSETWLTGSIRD